MTHTLINTTRTWNHDARESQWSNFRYAASGEQDLYLIYETDYETLSANAGSSTAEDELPLILTQPITLKAGKYRLELNGYEDGVEVDLLPDGVYEVGARARENGWHYDGETIDLYTGVYCIGSIQKVTGLKLVPQTDSNTLIPHDTHQSFSIEEPIGFDKLQVELKRHEYHGVGAEVSVGTLEFYGLAADIIDQQYSTDIDLDVTYEVRNDGTLLYQGKVDLSTVNIKEGEYKSVSAKVGEIGVKTTFNNRTDTEINLNVPKTVDGEDVNAPNWLNLHIPLKHLPFTNYSKQTRSNTITESGNSNTGVLISQGRKYIFFTIGDENDTKFGTFNPEIDPAYSVDAENLDAIDPQYISTEDFATQFGTNVNADVDIDLWFYLKFPYSGSHNPAATRPWDRLRFYLEAHYLYNNGDVVVESDLTGDPQGYNSKSYIESHMVGGEQMDDYMYCYYHLTLKGTLPADGSIKYYVVADFSRMTPEHISGMPLGGVPLTVLAGSYVRLTIFDTLTDLTPVYADMLLVHDALNVVSQAISENALSVKSEWYRSPESYKNAGSIGGGACKAITNGYHIRGLMTEGDNERNMPISFKELIESLSAQDCIGWGFSTESNVLCVRVERWDWFFKNTTLLNITDAAEVNIELYTDYVPTELKIGYKKFATQEQYQSIDSPHGTREFVNGIKAVSKTITKQCEFIADNYAIEETRRAKFQKDKTEESTYDENTFIFELVREAPSSNVNDGTYVVGHTAYNAVNVGRVEEFINAKLTPRHMAARWRSILYAANNPTPFKFKTGEINYKASFNCIPTEATANNKRTNSLQSMATDSPQAENSDISYTAAKFKAEKITFSYPITLAQYNAIKANPYGLIGVNGRYGWIMDFKYTLVTGMADFTLIAKR